MPRRPRLLVTLGDPCGIGPELLLVSLHALNRWADVTVVGARAGLDLLAALPNAPKAHWRWGDPPPGTPVAGGGAAWRLWTGPAPGFTEAESIGEALWIDPTPDLQAGDLQIGQGGAGSGRAAVEAVRTGAAMVLAGDADALVTLPLAKSAAHAAGFDIPGHTEFLQELSGSPMTRMAFVSPSLCVVLHTVHQSLRSVVEELDAEAVAETLGFAADRFIQLTGKMDLRVALCALNPHAGEGGAFGDEETLLQEALTLAEASFLDFNLGEEKTPFPHVASPFPASAMPEGWRIFPTGESRALPSGAGRTLELEESRPGPAAPLTHPAPVFFGPLPSDSLFHRAAKGEFDLVVALYHDQGLIPLKVLEPTRAVNLTLGLPFIRTSPDHGTAFDRAGTWTADATNFLEAAALAVRLAGRARSEAWTADTNGT